MLWARAGAGASPATAIAMTTPKTRARRRRKALTSGLRPRAEQVVIAARQRHHAGVVGHRVVHLVDRHVEIEEERPVALFAHHALDPEERGEAGASGYRVDAVQARGGVEDHVTGRQLHGLGAVRALDDELTAVVLL